MMYGVLKGFLVLVACVGVLMFAGCGEVDPVTPPHEQDHDHHHDHEHPVDAWGDADPVPHDQLEPSGMLHDGVRHVEVSARRYEFEPAVVVVRSGETVHIMATSEDVTHGLAIDEYDINVTLEPGETAYAEFTAGEPGEHLMYCSVYCGPGHSGMHGTLVVLEAD